MTAAATVVSEEHEGEGVTRLFDNATIRTIIYDQQRISHALVPRHWHTDQPTYRQLQAAIARVLRSSLAAVHVAPGIRLGEETVTVYTRQVMLARQQRWLSVAIYATGTRAGRLATALEPTAAQLVLHGLR